MTASVPDRRVTSVVNAMTIDVEDYFHVSVFDGVLPRRQWQDLESRVCANTDRLLAVFDDAGVRATFFVLGWVAERFPALVRRIADEDLAVSTEDAHRLVRRLAREEGLMVGVSAGAALSATLKVARRLKEGVVVTVFPDGAEKYLSESFWAGED